MFTGSGAFVDAEPNVFDMLIVDEAHRLEYNLASQSRCSGSDGYLAWLDHMLDIRPTANERLDASEYDFRVFDIPEALYAAIEARYGVNKARLVAGYCWP